MKNILEHYLGLILWVGWKTVWDCDREAAWKNISFLSGVDPLLPWFFLLFSWFLGRLFHVSLYCPHSYCSFDSHCLLTIRLLHALLVWLSHGDPIHEFPTGAFHSSFSFAIYDASFPQLLLSFSGLPTPFCPFPSCRTHPVTFGMHRKGVLAFPRCCCHFLDCTYLPFPRVSNRVDVFHQLCAGMVCPRATSTFIF